MNKSFIILVVAVIALGAGITLFFMKKTADAASHETNKILNDFKAVDERLNQTAVVTDSAAISNYLKDSSTHLKDSLLKVLKLTKDTLKMFDKERESLYKTASPLKY